MAYRITIAIKAIALLVILIIVTNILVPQSRTTWRRNKAGTSDLGPDPHCELEPNHQRNKVHSTFTLVPEMLQNTTLLIIINTAPSDFEKRNTLRKTWAKQSSWKFAANASSSLSDSGGIVNITYFFTMGFDGYSSIDEGVESESRFHKDILRVNLRETYRLLVNKTLLTFKWVTTLDIKPLFIAKANHDVYVKVPELAALLKTYSSSPRKLYAGLVMRNSQVHRDVLNSWYVSKEDYKEDVFPPFCLEPFYLFSLDLFLDVVNASKENEPFPVEDAYMGYLVQKIGVEPLDTGRDLFNANRGLDRTILDTPENKINVPSGIVLGDLLSSAAINLIHRVYTRSSLTKVTKGLMSRLNPS